MFFLLLNLVRRQQFELWHCIQIWPKLFLFCSQNRIANGQNSCKKINTMRRKERTVGLWTHSLRVCMGNLMQNRLLRALSLATHARALGKLIHLLAPNFLTLIPSALSMMQQKDYQQHNVRLHRNTISDRIYSPGYLPALSFGVFDCQRGTCEMFLMWFHKQKLELTISFVIIMHS